MKTIEIEFTAEIKGIEFTHTFEFTDCETEEDVKKQMLVQYYTMYYICIGSLNGENKINRILKPKK